MSDNINRYLPYEGQKDWGDSFSKTIKALDGKMASLQAEFSKRQEELKPMVYLSSGVVGYPDGNSVNTVSLVSSTTGPITEETEIANGNELEFNYNCYFSDNGSGTPVLTAVSIRYTVDQTSSSEELSFVPLFLKYDQATEGVVVFSGSSVAEDVLSHPHYILVGVIKKHNGTLSYIPKVETSNKTVSEKVTLQIAPKISTNRLSLSQSSNANYVLVGQATEEGGATTEVSVDYLLVALGLKYPLQTLSGQVYAFENKQYSYPTGMSNYHRLSTVTGGVADTGTNGVRSGRLLIGNNKTFIVQEIIQTNISTKLSLEALRATAFDALDFTYGDYVEVARYSEVRTAGTLNLVNVYYGGAPSLGVPNLVLSTDNVIDEDTLKIKSKSNNYYGFTGVGVTGSPASPGKFNLKMSDGADVLSGIAGSETTTGGSRPFKQLPYSINIGSSWLRSDNMSVNKVIVETAELEKNALKFSTGIEVKKSGNNLLLTGYGGSTTLLLGESVDSNVAMKAKSFNTTSDRRLKEDIKPAPKAEISALPVYSYKLKGSSESLIGIMAQDLQEIAPELVSTDASGFLSIKESKLIYMLMQEVRELKEEVKNLKR